jgi:hypothetical protein
VTPIRIAALALSLALTACSHPVPTATVEVIDSSLSITPRAEKAVLDAVQEQIAHLGRGDSLVLIPITGDAENDAGSRILRLQAPTIREPYDADLRRFRENARKQFVAWIATVHAEPGRTDILGALDAARQELGAFQTPTTQRLIVVSDFIEDDGRYRFTSASALMDPGRARALALRLHAGHGFTFNEATLCLGRLESTDFGPLSTERKQGVNAFWQAYFADQNREPEIQMDGIACLAHSSTIDANGK